MTSSTTFLETPDLTACDLKSLTQRLNSDLLAKALLGEKDNNSNI
tara:strand:+ start:526 stop:660 length:135 start_codon:yes stop_codon:yes gene_type:complete